MSDSATFHVCFPVTGGTVDVRTEFPMELLVKAVQDDDAARFIIADLFRAAQVVAPCGDQARFDV